MRRFCPSLFTPFDPVVGIHRSRGEADASLNALRNEGYGSNMLAVIGERRSDDDTGDIANDFGNVRSHWACSGLLWGLFWAGAAILAARIVPMGSGALGALLIAGALALVAQVAIVSRLIAPEANGAGLTSMNASSRTEDLAPSLDWRFVVLVRGSRSEIALAKAILAQRNPSRYSQRQIVG